MFGHQYVFFGERPIRIFCTFFSWVVLLLLSCMGCLYILEIKLLSVASFATIFSHSVDYLFIFLKIVSCAVQKLRCLIRSHLYILVISIVLGD